MVDAALALRPIPQRVHAQGANILLRILRVGRYGRHRAAVDASAVPADQSPY
jgi:2,4-dienoyl-CoA reductase-like NADH-dependent reductase (Old Yellow Enzyme family)